MELTWAGWASVSEGSSTPGGRVAAVPWGNNIALFLADPNGGIYTALGDPQAGFGPWRSVSEGSSTPGAPVTAIPWGNNIALFLADPNGGIYTALGDPQAGFGPWRSVSEGSSTPGAPVTAIPWGNNIALFLADPNGGIYTALGDPNYAADHVDHGVNFAGFGPWRSVSEGSSTPGAPVTAIPWGNSIALFIADPNGGIYTALGDPNYAADHVDHGVNFAGFGPWRSVSEGSSTPGAPVTAIPWGNNIALFIADPNGGIYTALGDPNYAADHVDHGVNFAGFGEWRSVSEGSSTPGARVTAIRGNNIALFLADPNGGIYTASGDPNYAADHVDHGVNFAGFGSWGLVSGPSDRFRAAPGSPVTAVPYGGRFALFVADPNGRILTTFDLPINGSPGQWLSIGPTRIDDGGVGAIGQLTGIAIHPTDPSTMYVGGGRCGLWKTTDGGANWAAIGDSLLPTMAIAAIAIDPSNPSQVYVATDNTVYGFGGGVFRSVDGGVSWVMISGDQQAQVIFGVLIVDPANPSTLYLSSGQGVLRSSDAGATNWQLSLSGGPVTGLVLDPTNTSTLYAAIAGVGVFKTTTGGQGGSGDWTKLTSGLPASGFSDVRLALCGANPATVYASVRTTAGFQTFRTTDGGTTWNLRSTLPLANGTNHVCAVDQSNPEIVYSAGIRFYRSTDGGANFSDKNAPHDDHHAFASNPIAPSTIYALGDGGIFSSSDRGDSWAQHGAGISNVLFYDIAISLTDPDLVIGGTQDNGTVKYRGGDTIWKESSPCCPPCAGDGATVAIDPTNAQILYAMDQYIGSIGRSTDGGASWQCIGAGLPQGEVCSNAHFQVHPTEPVTLLASCMSLWRSTDSGAHWSAIFTPTGDSIIRSAVDPTDDLYYAASVQGALFAGVGGGGWSQVFASGCSGVSDLCIDPVNPKIVYATLGSGDGIGGCRVFRLVRSTSGATAASDIAANLPRGLSAQAIAVHPRLRTVFVGTNRGVFQGVSVDGGVTWSWSPYNAGLPPADVRRLLFYPTGLLRVGTFGSGAYEVFVSWAG